ncbi:tetratricopeptide repeat protein [Verrucomicrobiota bacterium]
MDIQAFIGQRIHSCSKSAGQTGDLSQCMKVDKTVPLSIAGGVGVRAGDLLLSVDTRPAASVELEKQLDRNAQHTYVFFSPATGETTTLESTGGPLGAKLSPGDAALLARIESGDGEVEELDAVWERGDWALLERASELHLPSLLFLKKRNSPALVLLGAAKCEQDGFDEGIKLVHEYAEKYEKFHTMQYHAIGRYYLGVEALHTGDQQKAVALLNEAIRYWPVDRIADDIEALTGTRPPQRKAREGTRFPIDYNLPRLEGHGFDSLPMALGGMADDQLLVLCLLPAYRANGPYSEFMRTYTWLAAHFREQLAPLHVVTTETDRSACREWWFEGEDLALSTRIPFKLLHDCDMAVTDAIRPTGSPLIMVLDSAGTILKEEDFDGTILWELLSRNG